MRQIKKFQKGRNGFQFMLGHELRNELQPIVFFDAGTMDLNQGKMSFPIHPHSGIGIVSYFEGMDLVHHDSAGNDGIIPAGGMQWIKAGNGIWHKEGYRESEEGLKSGKGSMHQLWLALPPDLEETDPEYRAIEPNEIPKKDGVRVLAGNYEGLRGPLELPVEVTYLDIELQPGEDFVWKAPDSQQVAILFLRQGELKSDGTEIPKPTMTVFEEGDESFSFQSPETGSETSKFILITAKKTQQQLIAAHGSIHSSIEAMNRSEARIEELKKDINEDYEMY